jgi:hypothetical protein
MKKSAICFLLFLFLGGFIFLFSCDKDDPFSTKNTFNLDTLYANPNSGITDHFQLIWEVSIEGFPQFLIDVYLSDDEFLDPGDLKIIETADTDVTTDPDQPYVNGINIRMTPIPGSGVQIEFNHDQITWQSGILLQENPSGKTKYLIGRFYHPQGLQISVGRSRMTVEVMFD